MPLDEDQYNNKSGDWMSIRSVIIYYLFHVSSLEVIFGVLLVFNEINISPIILFKYKLCKVRYYLFQAVNSSS